LNPSSKDQGVKKGAREKAATGRLQKRKEERHATGHRQKKPKKVVIHARIGRRNPREPRR